MTDFRESAVNQAWKEAEKIDLIRVMVRNRRFEQRALNSYLSGKIGGWLIQSIGQESVAACARSVMGPLDHGISGCRGIGHALAAGMSMESCMAEFFGRVNGCSKGKAGAFGFYAPELRHWGCHGLAGAQTPLAAGLAFGIKHRNEHGAVLCFLGDGAVNTGAFHESLNLAGLFDLPAVYLIENNGYAMGTSGARSSAFRGCLARRAESYGIDWDHFSDGDPYEMRARLHTALERARTGNRPTVVEVSTYRYYGFTIADAMHKRYRTLHEIEERKSRDPLTLWKERMIREGVIRTDEFEAMDQEIKSEALAAADAADAGEIPNARNLATDVYWECDHHTVAGTTGRHFFDPP
jgi:pyruvate dehydrogenase E1 component alpha subunit